MVPVNDFEDMTQDRGLFGMDLDNVSEIFSIFS